MLGIAQCFTLSLSFMFISVYSGPGLPKGISIMYRIDLMHISLHTATLCSCPLKLVLVVCFYFRLYIHTYFYVAIEIFVFLSWT